MYISYAHDTEARFCVRMFVFESELCYQCHPDDRSSFSEDVSLV